MSALKPKKPVTHVLFDMDGLLLDTERLYEKAINTLTTRYGYEFPFELKMKIMGRIGEEGAKIIIDELKLPITFDEYLKQIDHEYNLIFKNEPIELMPGVERLIKHLYKNNIPMAIATSSKYETFKLKTRNHQELLKLFNHILIASNDPEIKRGKPDPQTFLICAKRFNNPKLLDMSNVLVFEDSIAGIQAANAAGMQSIWIPDSRIPKTLIQSTLTLNSMEEFTPELFGLPPFE